jgi:MFS family permease
MRPRDSTATAAAVVLFSFGLGVSSLALPLLAAAAGYDLREIGLITAISAGAQLAIRPSVPWLSRRVADRTIVAAAAAMLALSCALAAASTAPAVLAAAALLQGVGRAYFWSGSQLHGVRTSPSALSAISRLNLISGVGMLTGPVVAGLLAEQALDLALALGAVVCGLGIVAAQRMALLPPLAPRDGAASRGLFRRPGVLKGSVLSAGSGAWTSMALSFLPLVLADRQSPALVGGLMALAHGANITGSAVIARSRPASTGRWMVACALANGIGLALVAPTAGILPLVALALVLSGLGAGALLSLGPAMATAAVSDDERATALAVTGSARAGAMLLAPLGVASVVSVLPLAAALAAVGVLLAVPMRPVRQEGAR